MAFSTSWEKYFEIDSDSSRVPSDQTGVHSILDLSILGSGHGFWTNIESDAASLRFTDENDDEVAFHIRNFDKTGKKGQIWFLGDYTGATDTKFRSYYKNSGASAYSETDTYGQHAVYDSNFKGFWPFDEATAEDVKDMTGNSVDEGAGSSSATTATGKVGKCFDFNGSSNNITFESGVDTNLSPTGDMQIEIWFYAHAKGSDVLWSTRLDSTNKGWGIWFWNSNLRISNGVASSGDVWSNLAYPLASISLNTWYKVVYNRNGNTHKLYVNDVEVDSYSKSGSTAYSGSQMNVGTRASGDDFDGLLDLLKVHDTYRAVDWNTIVYEMESDNAGFWTVGAEQDNVAAASGVRKQNISI